MLLKHCKTIEKDKIITTTFWKPFWHYTLIYNRTTEEHLDHIRQVFKKLWNAQLLMKLNKCHFFAKEIQYLGYILSTMDIRPLPSKTQSINTMHPPKTAKQVCTFPGLVRYCRKFIKNFAKIAKPLTLLAHLKAKFEWAPAHNTAIMTLKEAIIQAPMLCYPDPMKQYIFYTDALDDACGAQLPQDMMGPNSQVHSYLTPSLKNKGS